MPGPWWAAALLLPGMVNLFKYRTLSLSVSLSLSLSLYRGTSLIKHCPPPYDHRRAPDIVLL